MWQVAQMFERIYAAAKKVFGDFKWLAPWNPEGDPTMAVGEETDGGTLKGVTGNGYDQGSPGDPAA